MAKIRIDDVSLHVVDRGRGDPLLLVHGFPLDHSMWRYQVEALAATHRVVAPDLRGFGLSDLGEAPWSMERLADDLALLLDALEIRQPVTYCGFSMGGYVAWQFLARHGDRVQRLILCDTLARADSDDAASARLETAELVLREGSGVVAAAMLPRLFAAESLRRGEGFVEQTRSVMLASDPLAIASALRGMARRIDARSWLPDVGVPALLVCGELDVISSTEEMRSMAEAIPDSQLVEIGGAGHLAPLEKPEPVSSAIARFLGRTTLAGGP